MSSLSQKHQGIENGTYEPQQVKKISNLYEGQIKIISMYALGNSNTQISEHTKATISTVIDKNILFLQEWKCRPLNRIYPFV